MKRAPDADLYFPDGEEHFLSVGKKTKRPVWMDYQRDRVDCALQRLPHTRQRGIALDVGAHVGLVTRYLAGHFAEVWAFEPSPSAFECLEANTRHLPNVRLFNVAAGNVRGRVGLDSDADVGGNSGNRQVNPEAGGRAGVEQIRLDDLVFPRPVDLVKIDVQGYESRVLEGMKQTLIAFAPTLIVEVEPPGKLRRAFDPKRTALKLLRSWDARLVNQIGDDYIYTWGHDGACPYTKYSDRGDYHWQGHLAGKQTKLRNLVTRHVRHHDPCPTPILDVGCGDGVYTFLLGEGAFGIDNNYTAIRLAKARGVPCEHVSVYRLGDLDRKFEAATLFDVFEHLPQQDLVLANLKAAGVRRLYFLNPAPDCSPWHYCERTDDELADFLSARGWEESGPRVHRATGSPIHEAVMGDKTFMSFKLRGA